MHEASIQDALPGFIVASVHIIRYVSFLRKDSRVSKSLHYFAYHSFDTINGEKPKNKNSACCISKCKMWQQYSSERFKIRCNFLMRILLLSSNYYSVL